MDSERGRTYRGDVPTGDPQQPDGGRSDEQDAAGRPSHDHPPLVYNPYGGVAYPPTYPTYPTPPAGLGPDDMATPARRPGSVHLGLVLLLVSALPYLLVGLLALVGAGDVAAAVPPEQLDQLRALGVDPEQLLRTTGVVMLAVALLFVLLAVLAWTGRGWARALLTAMTAGFALLVVGSLVAASGQGVPVDGASLLVIAGPLALAVVGLVLMFGSAARAWFSRR